VPIEIRTSVTQEQTNKQTNKAKTNGGHKYTCRVNKLNRNMCVELINNQGN